MGSTDLCNSGREEVPPIFLNIFKFSLAICLSLSSLSHLALVQNPYVLGAELSKDGLAPFLVASLEQNTQCDGGGRVAIEATRHASMQGECTFCVDGFCTRWHGPTR